MLLCFPSSIIGQNPCLKLFVPMSWNGPRSWIHILNLLLRLIDPRQDETGYYGHTETHGLSFFHLAFLVLLFPSSLFLLPLFCGDGGWDWKGSTVCFDVQLRSSEEFPISTHQLNYILIHLMGLTTSIKVPCLVSMFCNCKNIYTSNR